MIASKVPTPDTSKTAGHSDSNDCDSIEFAPLRGTEPSVRRCLAKHGVKTLAIFPRTTVLGVRRVLLRVRGSEIPEEATESFARHECDTMSSHDQQAIVLFSSAVGFEIVYGEGCRGFQSGMD